MNAATFADRTTVVAILQSNAGTIAESVTDEFLTRHPDWTTRYGAAARVRGIEDAHFHIEFLNGAILSGGVAAFTDYARWTAGMLSARGIDMQFLLENFRQIKEHAAEYLSSPQADIVRHVVDGGIAAMLDPQAAGLVNDDSRTNDADLRIYLSAAINGDRRTALTVAMEQLHRGLSMIDVYQDLLQPAQYEIGRLWEQNTITVAREHAATAVTQYVVARLYDAMPVPTEVRGNAVVTGVRGELHQIGANMISDALEMDGWNVRFLGTQVPHRDILQVIEEHSPTLVGISTSVLSNLSSAGDLIEQMRKEFNSEVRVLVGGGAFRAGTEVWRDMGADAVGSDLRDARNVVDRLLPPGN